MTSHRNGYVSSTVNDYKNLNTIPATLGVAFVIATLIQFNAFPPLSFNWIDYTVEPLHGVVTSLAVYGVAFASSETRAFSKYSDGEKAAIACGPVLILAHHFVPQVADLVSHTPPGTEIIAFLVVMASYGVAVR